jgi:hypothetical protein
LARLKPCPDGKRESGEEEDEEEDEEEEGRTEVRPYKRMAGRTAVP